MSYDLIVFDPDVAPREMIAEWYGDVMEADADYDTSDPSSTSPRLRAFYDEMRRKFPPLNGPHANRFSDSDFLTGYEFHPGLIYMDFRWSRAEAAGTAVLAGAEKHGIGMFDPQDSGDGVMLVGAVGKNMPPRKPRWARLFK